MGDGQKQSGMALKRSIPLLHQEEEAFRVREGVHKGNNGVKNTVRKTENKRREKHADKLIVWVRCSVTLH